MDIGYRINHYSDFIQKEFGEELVAESFSKYKLPDTHYETHYTYTCEITKRSALYVYCYTTLFFLRALFRYQVFHFISGETILPWKLRGFELACYRLLGKKIIMHFVGSDIRSETYLQEKNDHLAAYLRGEYLIREPISSPIQQKLIRQVRKNVSKILVSTPDLLDLVPEATYIPVFLDLNHFIYENTEKSAVKKSVISILHSPSAARTKGSGHLTQVFENLKNTFGESIEFITPVADLGEIKWYATTRYDLLNKMAGADIVIDQLVIGWYGLKTIEALELNCEVVCFIEEKLLRFLPENAPITHATILNIESRLAELIQNIQSGKSDAAEKQAYVRKNHNMESYKELFRNLWLQ